MQDHDQRPAQLQAGQRTPHEHALAGDHDAWPRLIDAVGPAWLLVAIRARMSAAMQQRYEPEDVLQDTLLHAWRDRARCHWQGVRAFRAWLLEIADNRLRDLAQHDGRVKRGGRSEAALGQLPESALPPGTTTPGRLAAWREQAESMHAALATLPSELRDVVRLRLFEELPMEAVAARLGIGLSAAKHRLRKGAELFRRRVRLATTSAAPLAGSSP
jgi:RNA polymerase sigma factor (sigma-70 family)